MLKHTDIKKTKAGEESKTKKQHSLLEIKDYLDFKYEFRRNELTLEIEVRLSNEEYFVLLDEAFVNSIWIDLQIDGYKCSDTTLLKSLIQNLLGNITPLKTTLKH